MLSRSQLERERSGGFSQIVKQSVAVFLLKKVSLTNEHPSGGGGSIPN
jgi:hypothetical protein